MANSILEERRKMLKSTTSKNKGSKNHTSCTDSDGEVDIQVETLTNHPTQAWDLLKKSHKVIQLDPGIGGTKPRAENALRFVCLSDTHGTVEQARREFDKRVPDGDVLIHCGDFSMAGDPSEITAFDSFIARLPHQVKLVIAGNHELTFEDASFGVHPVLVRKKLGLPLKASPHEVMEGCKALLEHALYLEDESLQICGINIYGSPWVPTFGSWGFSAKRGENLLQKWNKIPSDTDILITHGPPLGYGDSVSEGNRAGCAELLNTVVKRVRPKYHVFGHIHSGYGMWTNGKTVFINAAICSNRYKPDHDPIVFDYPLPQGYTRQDFAQLSTESLRQARATATAAAEQCTERNGDDDSHGEHVGVESHNTTSPHSSTADGVLKRSRKDGEKPERSKEAKDLGDCTAGVNDLAQLNSTPGGLSAHGSICQGLGSC